jgi:hypothetical protein
MVRTKTRLRINKVKVFDIIIFYIFLRKLPSLPS